MVRRDGGRVPLLTRNGHDWAARYLATAAVAAALPPHYR
jgi:ATP-dependent DNA ligase